jgi:hypothetical protein
MRLEINIDILEIVLDKCSKVINDIHEQMALKSRILQVNNIRAWTIP